MQLMLDLPQIPITTMPFIIGIVLIVILVALVYIFRLRPTFEKPLPNERSRGHVKIHLHTLGRFYDGEMTDARDTVQSWFAKSITNEPDHERQKQLLTIRDRILKFHLQAQKVDGGKVIYAFDKDPFDPQYCSPEGKPGMFNEEAPLYIGPVQDARSVGKWDGFEWVGVKLGEKTAAFTDEEGSALSAMMDLLKYERVAANSKETIKFLKEQAETEKAAKIHEMEEKAKMRSLLDRSLSFNAQKIFSVTPEQAKMGGALGAKLKQWFTWPQLICAGIGYLVSPQIIGQFQPGMSPPNTTYVTALITVVAFFIIPVGKKVFGRWL